ncbi:MAG: hypothetical protein [Bacteriophage sp.]|nr:MAG: hypothetical protein [Bacteriophage sp.]
MVTDEMVRRAATEYLSHRGERPYRVTRRGAELWEDHAPAMRAALEDALSAAEPVAWQPRYKQEVIDHLRTVSDNVSEYAMTVFPTKEQAEEYGHGGHDVRPLYAEPVKTAPSVAVKALKWVEGAPGTYTEIAESPFGHYSVWEINGTACWSPWKQGYGSIVEGGLAGARAAAQSDYEARILSALSAQVQDVAGLDERMKAAGMYTIAEMMGITPLTKWTSNPAINTIEHFSEWLDRKTAEYLRMKAAYELGDKSQDDELYEWVLAHSGVFSTIRDQFRVVIAAPAKQEGKP